MEEAYSDNFSHQENDLNSKHSISEEKSYSYIISILFNLAFLILKRYNTAK